MEIGWVKASGLEQHGIINLQRLREDEERIENRI
jgi:hypothetical protein